MINTPFTYKNNKLFCDNVSIDLLVEKFDTPLYVYSKKYFIERYNEFLNAFNGLNFQIFYAMKANSNLSIVKTFVELGAGLDVNSEGELIRALKTGINPINIILTGLGKTDKEISLGIDNNVLMIKAESEEELLTINKIASEKNKIAKVALRVNPDVNPNTHPYISTGLLESKFGIDFETAKRLYLDKERFKNIKFTGIDMHIGSQITSPEPFIDAVKRMSELFFFLKENKIELEHFDIGGGFGVEYNSEKTFEIKELAEELIPILNELNCRILFEPGRFLTANAGALITKVIYTKNNTKKNFIIVDAGMNDLLRPSIYSAYHEIIPVVNAVTRNKITTDIVGPVCESGDFLAKNRKIQSVKRNELLAVLSAGAYGMVMASNYNSRRRPAEVMVNDDEYNLIRGRETFEHLMYDEEIKMK